MARKRTLTRRTEHSVIERRRREKINERLVCLQHTVPACRAKALDVVQRRMPEAHDAHERITSEMVLEKLCIITHTAEYIAELHERLAAAEARMAPAQPSAPPPPPPRCHHTTHSDTDSDEDAGRARAAPRYPLRHSAHIHPHVHLSLWRRQCVLPPLVPVRALYPCMCPVHRRDSDVEA